MRARGITPAYAGKRFPSTCAGCRSRITPAYAGKSRFCARLVGSRRDHPCVCGEKNIELWCRYVVQGSPLRMRGKEERKAIVARAKGITPAYAGKSRSNSERLSMHTDHPCVCGEKSVVPAGISRGLGSPLRMRGKASVELSPCSRIGITPAYAGKRRREWNG